MAIRAIIVSDNSTLEGVTDSVLRSKYAYVKEFGVDLENVVNDLRDTLRSDTLSVGLAAPQIGYPLAVAVVNLDKDEKEDLVLINPVILSESGSWDIKYESCMSIPHKKGQIRRRKKIKVQYNDIKGEKIELEASGFLARVILHEIDHLNGILYVDRMDEEAPLEETDLFREHGIE